MPAHYAPVTPEGPPGTILLHNAALWQYVRVKSFFPVKVTDGRNQLPMANAVCTHSTL